MELRLLQSLTTRKRPQSMPRLCGASHEVWSPSAPAIDGIHDESPGLASPGYGPPTGFRTLLAVCTPADLPALFHAGDAHGVSPFRAFPSLEAVAPLDARSPRAVSPTLRNRVDPKRAPRLGTRPRHGERAESQRQHREEPDSKAWHLSGVRLPQLGVSLTAGSMLSWGSSLFRASRDPDLGQLLPAILHPWTSPPRPAHASNETGAESDAGPSEYHSVRSRTC
jgi:hypothetical protein